ncbi:MAG: prepilin-type N-terminal cleavage/methylation domain-containing protein [Ruminiclostridium sp.]|nr:prepilin-type N-terminal cleavage/methylation domain-containing protein [Ruminiclostridium sp.]
MVMKRLLSKKGITLVEIIVVIAIIGILTAIVVPLLSNTSSYETEAMENARAFYSNVQQVMVQEKFAKTLLNDDLTKKDNKKYTLIYAEVKTNTADGTGCTIKIGFTDDSLKSDRTTEPTFSEPKECSETYCKALTELSGTLKKMLAANEHDGHFYAIVDSKYRVVSTYYSIYGDYSIMNGNTFSADFRVSDANGEYIAGAYPYNLLNNGSKVFVDPNNIYEG